MRYFLFRGSDYFNLWRVDETSKNLISEVIATHNTLLRVGHICDWGVSNIDSYGKEVFGDIDCLIDQLKAEML